MVTVDVSNDVKATGDGVGGAGDMFGLVIPEERAEEGTETWGLVLTDTETEKLAFGKKNCSIIKKRLFIYLYN